MLSDILKPRITELGSIRIGKKGEERQGSNGTYRLPQKLDHFIITKLTRDAKEDLVQDTDLMTDLIAQGYGDQDGHLRRIPIRVLSNDPEDIMQASYCWYAGKKLGARSDGRRATFFIGSTSKDWTKPLEQPIETDWESVQDLKDGKGNRLFKIHATFNCMIASKSARFGGVYKFRTTSRITADQLYGGLGQILQLTNGILMGMPLQLCIRPIQVSPETPDGKKLTTKVYIVHVELVGEDLRAIQQQANEQARYLLETTDSTKRALALYRKVLRTPGDELDPVEIADIQQEFHPDENTDDQPESFPMPQPTDATPPPTTTEVEDPTAPPTPPAEETKAETKPKERKKRQPKKTDTIDTSGEAAKVNKPVEQPKEEPKVEEKPATVLPENTDPKLTPRQLAEKGLAHWENIINEVKTVEELQEMKAPGHPFVAFYQACQADKFNDIANQAAEHAKNKKIGLLRRSIEDIYMADDWTDKAVKELAKSIGIPDINNMDAPQAEKLLAKMSEKRKEA